MLMKMTATDVKMRRIENPMNFVIVATFRCHIFIANIVMTTIVVIIVVVGTDYR